MALRKYGEMVKLKNVSIVKWFVWIYLAVACVIILALVYLYLIQH